MLRNLLLAGVALATPSLAHAQAADPVPAADAGQDQAGARARDDASPHSSRVGQPGDLHAEESNDIVVTGFQRSRGDLLSGTSVVSGDELTRDLRPSIGETLQHLPGVSATSFGPNASRPVLRGFQGERVRVLTDGIGSLDVSSTSADHAVAINPLTADRIEVLRGPSALLFGSSAIGGVVNVIDSRIPRRVPDEPVHVDGILTYGSAANERSASAAVDLPVGGNFVLHVDGNYSKTDDLEIGGHALTPALRAQALASPDPDIRALADIRGRLPNSAAETSDIAAGAVWIDGENNVGFSVNRYDSRYGVPIRYSLDPAVEAEAPRIDIGQTRVDGRAEIDTGAGFLDNIRLRAGYSDYRHFELEEDGAVGTRFDSTGYEGRAEFRQSTRGGWGGGFGAQYFHRSFDVEGAEKFLPANRTSQFGLFVLQTLDRGAFKAEGGLRYEHTALSADADPVIGNPDLRRSFDAFTASAGASYAVAPGWRIGLNASHSERAPSAEELFANGPHAGTQSFEVGDPDLGVERSWGIEATLRGSGNGYSLSASVFHSWFDGYIFETPTGAIQDDLPVFQYFQADARYFGVELEGSVKLGTVGPFDINVDGVADYVRATIQGAGPAPRIPPVRLLGGLEAQSDRVNGRVEVEWVGDQDRIAAFETPTDGYTMVNASLSFHPFGSGNNSTIVLSANNIFDVVARRHASFLKDYAPLAGRDLRISARITF
ncbi:MAG TPA: TonB-dependent receptor [Allosphingosinicella sp.]|nr:TonB-dependent receptor [Allosphingosinicella sp.]